MYQGFGLWNECPEEVEVAWGARAILNNGQLDFIHDRMTWNGTQVDNADVRKAFTAFIDFHVIESRVKELSDSGELRGNHSHTFTLLDTPDIRILANTNASYGYLYIVAFKP